MIGIAALITALASLLGVAGTFTLAVRSQKMSRINAEKVQEVHVLVNSRLTDETTRVGLLEGLLEANAIPFPERNK
jgi:hypothetical protein